MSRNPVLAEWLFENGGPIVRYRTATELLNQPPVAPALLFEEVLTHPEVQRWMANLGRGPIHHSRDTAAENALAKLLEYGLRAGIPALDEKALPYCEEVRRDPGHYHALILVPFLIRGGYWRHEAVNAWFLHRLDALHRTAQRGEFDVHLGVEDASGVPSAWRDKLIYKPEFDPNGDAYPLPTCYDFYALAHYPQSDPGIHGQIEDVVAYLCRPEFQSIPGGYIWDRARRTCYAAGRVYLACVEPSRLLLFLELAARFVPGRKASWFVEGMAQLEGYRTDRGTYRFPSNLIAERRDAYYLYSGSHMGLGENRRYSLALEIESTFRMLRIKRLMAPEEGR